ncbi:MAG: Ig-like domain-containing protein, partial [Candidatus Angelobacter sp.]
MKHIVRLLCVTISLAAVSFAGVTISSPSNRSTVGSPTHVVASASSANPVTFMRIYVDNVSVFGLATSKIDTSLPMSAGTHSLVVQSWDSKGAVSKNAVSVTVSKVVSGVTISSPVSGSTVGSPVHVLATASSAQPITFMRVYVDNVSVLGVASSKVDNSIAMKAGRHSVVVQSWDSAGTVERAAVSISVGT